MSNAKLNAMDVFRASKQALNEMDDPSVRKDERKHRLEKISALAGRVAQIRSDADIDLSDEDYSLIEKHWGK